MEIKLTRGFVAIIDDEDYDLIKDYRWYTKEMSHTVYAQANISRYKGRGTIKLHRLIMDAKDGQIIDHINGNGLDNRRQNLRFVTAAQNQMNSRSQLNKTSKYKGVSLFGNKWRVVIKKDKKSKFLGLFDSETEAAFVYNKHALELFGEYAYLNELPVGTFFEDRVKKEKSSKYNGVTFDSKNNKWIAKIKINSKEKYLGIFSDELEAANYFNLAVKEYGADVSLLNEIPSTFVSIYKKKKITSKYRGVFFHKRDKKWVSSISYNKKQFSLGYFINENDAALAYNMAAIHYFGDKANLNVIE